MKRVNGGVMRPIEKLKPKPMVPFTAERKQRYLELFRHHPELGGRKYLCAEAVGVSGSTIDYHVKNDPEFAQALEDARQAWIDEHLFTAALKRARDGVERPIIGGKYKDQVVATERVYSDSLMLAMLRAHRPEFRDRDAADKQAADRLGTVGNGGVMVLPAAPSTISDWQKQFGELAKGTHGRPGGAA